MEAWPLPWEKAFSSVAELKYLLFSWNTIFTWKNIWQMYVEICWKTYLDLGIWQTFSQKWKNGTCHYKKKLRTIFIVNDKNYSFQWQLEFWKIWIYHQELEASQYLMSFQMRLVVMLINATLKILYNEVDGRLG